MNTATLRRQAINALDRIGFKGWAVRHVLYNPAWLAVLRHANRKRWRNIDLLVILWPPARSLFDQIEAEITAQYEILDRQDVELKPDTYEHFIKELYAIDYADPRKIALKLEALNWPPLTLRVLCIRIPKPDMIPQDALNRVRCRQIGDMKDAIRLRHRDRIPGYVYDVILHSTEADHQNPRVRALLEKYAVDDS